MALLFLLSANKTAMEKNSPFKIHYLLLYSLFSKLNTPVRQSLSLNKYLFQGLSS